MLQMKQQADTTQNDESKSSTKEASKDSEHSMNNRKRQTNIEKGKKVSVCKLDNQNLFILMYFSYTCNKIEKQVKNAHFKQWL